MNKYNPQIHHRRSIRLKGYDYAQSGAYFVTICTQGRVCLFGDVVDGEMVLNPFGQVVATYWERIPRHFPNVQLGAWVVMPNHIHGIIIITDDGDADGRGGASPESTTRTTTIANAHIPQSQITSTGCLALPLQQTPGEEGEAFLPSPGYAAIVENAEAPSPADQHGECPAPTTVANASSGSLGAIIGNVKSITTRRINKMRHMPGARIWQRNYWEHIIRTPESHARIEDYIRLNPARWQADQLHPEALPNPFNQER
ncbi:MAG: transposase [Anaerolineae bacterium]